MILARKRGEREREKAFRFVVCLRVDEAFGRSVLYFDLYHLTLLFVFSFIFFFEIPISSLSAIRDHRTFCYSLFVSWCSLTLMTANQNERIRTKYCYRFEFVINVFESPHAAAGATRFERNKNLKLFTKSRSFSTHTLSGEINFYQRNEIWNCLKIGYKRKIQRQPTFLFHFYSANYMVACPFIVSYKKVTTTREPRWLSITCNAMT